MFDLGYPVLDKKVEFKNNLAANVEDWNKYLMATRVIKAIFAEFEISLTFILYQIKLRCQKQKSCWILYDFSDHGVKPLQILFTTLKIKTKF